MDVLNVAFNALVSPTTWIPGIGAAVFLSRLRWPLRVLVAVLTTLVIGTGFALFLTPGDPGNVVRIIGAGISGGLWALIATFVVFGTQPGTRE